MANRLLLGALIATIVVGYALASNSTSPANVQLKVINPAGAPARLVNVTVQNDTGRQISLIHYQVTNETKQGVKRVILKIIFFDRWGNPVGGESFMENMSLKGHHTQEFLTPLAHYADKGWRVGVTVWSIESDNETWTTDTSTKEFVQRIKE